MSTHYRAMAMIVVLILAGACGTPRPTAAPLAVASTNTSLPPTATPVPVTNTPLPPTATTAPPAAMVVSPTDTALPVPSPTPTIPPVEVIQDIPYVPADVQTGIGGVAFADSGQSLGVMRSWDVALGDLDGDGDLDAFVANSVWSHVWLNDGQAAFTNSEQKLGTVSGLQLGDLDGDGDLDAFTVDAERGSVVWLNDGAAVFAAGQRTITATGYNVSLGDVDGDSDLDAYIAGEGANTLWLNDGQGEFTAGRQRFAGDRSIGAILADLDSDGDLDVFKIVYNGLHRVWFNDGTGTFTNSGQGLQVGTGNSHGAALGDLDGDGDLDAFVTVANKMAFQVWFNDGAGIFTNSGQSLPSSNAQMVALGDLDGDGDLDAFMTNTGNSDAGAGNTVWLNDGQGVFSDSGLRLGHEYSIGIALGDLDGDGDLDAFVANSNFADPAVDRANKVWLNFSAPLPETLPAGDEP